MKTLNRQEGITMKTASYLDSDDSTDSDQLQEIHEEANKDFESAESF